MPFPVMAALMAASTAAKMKQDADREKDDRNERVETIRNSPWTGLRPGQAFHADGAGTALQGFASGVSMDQAGKNQASQQKLMDAMAEQYKTPGASATAQVSTPTPTRVAAVPTGGQSRDDFGTWMSMRKFGQQPQEQEQYPWANIQNPGYSR